MSQGGREAPGAGQPPAGFLYSGLWVPSKNRCHAVTACSMGLKEKVKGRADSRRHPDPVLGTPWGIPAGGGVGV